MLLKNNPTISTHTMKVSKFPFKLALCTLSLLVSDLLDYLSLYPEDTDMPSSRECSLALVISQPQAKEFSMYR